MPLSAEKSLVSALKAAANPETGDVMILAVSDEQLEFLTNFILLAQKYGAQKHLMIVTEHQHTQARAKNESIPCYLFPAISEWINLRFTLIHDVLKMGYNVFFVNPFVLLQANPFEFVHQPQYSKADILFMQNDYNGVKGSPALKAKRRPAPPLSNVNITWVDGEAFYVRRTPA